MVGGKFLPNGNRDSSFGTNGVARGAYDLVWTRDAVAADSIKQHGIVQPIVVALHGEKLEILAGERRWRAAAMAGLEKVPVVFRDSTNQDRLEVALVENLQREDLNPLDAAEAQIRVEEALEAPFDLLALHALQLQHRLDVLRHGELVQEVPGDVPLPRRPPPGGPSRRTPRSGARPPAWHRTPPCRR